MLSFNKPLITSFLFSINPIPPHPTPKHRWISKSVLLTVLLYSGYPSRIDKRLKVDDKFFFFNSIFTICIFWSIQQVKTNYIKRKLHRLKKIKNSPDEVHLNTSNILTTISIANNQCKLIKENSAEIGVQNRTTTRVHICHFSLLCARNELTDFGLHHFKRYRKHTFFY